MPLVTHAAAGRSSRHPGCRRPDHDGFSLAQPPVIRIRSFQVALRVAAILQALAAPLAAAQSLPADAAEVIGASGQTTLVRGGSFQSPVRRDVPLRTGDRIRTGTDGVVQLRFTDGALMSIQPGSDFRIDAYAFDSSTQRGFFGLLQGTVRAVSGRIGKRDRDDWRLRTPTATLGIRGTEFTVTETPCPARGCAGIVDAGFSVSVSAGRVAVSNEAGSVEVPAGVSIRLADARTVPALALADAMRASAARPPRSTGIAAGQVAAPAPDPAAPPASIGPGTGSAPPAPSSVGRR